MSLFFQVLILLHSSEKKAYLGFIPHEQVQFVDRIRKVIQQQKVEQQQQQQQNQGRQQQQQQQQMNPQMQQQQMGGPQQGQFGGQQQQQQPGMMMGVTPNAPASSGLVTMGGGTMTMTTAPGKITILMSNNFPIKYLFLLFQKANSR